MKTPLTILIIEDHTAIAQNIAEYLEGKGHVTDYASNGSGGLALALANHYDVVVLDLMLPGMDGLTVCHNIREKALVHTPILMLTARDTLGTAMKAQLPSRLNGLPFSARQRQR